MKKAKGKKSKGPGQAGSSAAKGDLTGFPAAKRSDWSPWSLWWVRRSEDGMDKGLNQKNIPSGTPCCREHLSSGYY